ncbi:MAG: cupin domain-containing protein [Bryobacteraceae bacterium]
MDESIADSALRFLQMSRVQKKTKVGEMTGKFISSTEVRREELTWGSLAWFSSPTASNARDLVVLEVTLSPGGGHNFHKHPRQEELIYVIEGEVEQWLDREKRRLQAGDSVFIGADVVHASFNVSEQDVKLLAVLGPCVGPEGYELVDVAEQKPWASLRSQTQRRVRHP